MLPPHTATRACTQCGTLSTQALVLSSGIAFHRLPKRTDFWRVYDWGCTYSSQWPNSSHICSIMFISGLNSGRSTCIIYLHGITWRVSHVRQEMLTLPEHLISPFNGGFMLFLFYLPILPMSGQAIYWSKILVLFALEWTDFNVDECVLGWGSNVVVFELVTSFLYLHLEIIKVTQSNTWNVLWRMFTRNLWSVK